MKIHQSQIKKITITDISQLDNIGVYLEDYKLGEGKVIITCFDKSWTYYWAGMGNHTLAEFIIDCDNHYLSNKLNPNIKADIMDEDGLEDFVKKEVIRRRKEDCIDKNEARSIYDQCHDLYEMQVHDSQAYGNFMFNVFGDEWYDCYPTKPNPEYLYFCRILDVVKQTLKQLQKDQNVIYVQPIQMIKPSEYITIDIIL